MKKPSSARELKDMTADELLSMPYIEYGEPATESDFWLMFWETVAAGDPENLQMRFDIVQRVYRTHGVPLYCVRPKYASKNRIETDEKNQPEEEV